jgi:hypothetical protein
MICKRRVVAVAMLMSLGTAGMGRAVGQSSGVDRRTTAAAPTSDASRLSSQAKAVYKYVNTLKPGELKWQRVSWLIDLSEAMRQAKAENRPILIWATDDAPLERC